MLQNGRFQNRSSILQNISMTRKRLVGVWGHHTAAGLPYHALGAWATGQQNPLVQCESGSFWEMEASQGSVVLSRMTIITVSGRVCAQSLGRVQLFAAPGTAARRAPLSLPISRGLLRLVSVRSVILSDCLILCCLLLLLPSVFPAACQLVESIGQSIGASAPVLPMTIQGGFPLGLTSLISLQPKGLSRVFSSTRVCKHQFFGAGFYSQLAS